MSLSDPAFVGEVDDREVRKEIFHLPHEIGLKRIRIKISDIQSDITEIFLYDFHHIAETVFWDR